MSFSLTIADEKSSYAKLSVLHKQEVSMIYQEGYSKVSRSIRKKCTRQILFFTFIACAFVCRMSVAEDFVPFVIPAKPNVGSLIAVTSFEPIKTDSDRLQADNGHFYRGGKRVRLWGVNLSFGANLPRHEDAPYVAARLAAAGVNSVRCHHLDTARWPRGLWNAKDGKTITPEALDRLDYFIDQLTRYGICVNINLHVGRAHSQYLGDVSRAITKVDDFGAGEDANTIERISAAVAQDTRMLPAMTIAFSVPGTAGRIATAKIAKQATKDAQLQKELDVAIGLELNTPTQIETAEGIIGYEADFPLEIYEREKLQYKFKKPGLGVYLGGTPKWLVNRILGVETLLQDVEAAEISRAVEAQDVNSWINSIIKKIKKLKSLKQIPKLPLKEIAAEEAFERTKVVTEVFPQLETAEGVIGFETEYYEEAPDIAKMPAMRLRRLITEKNPIAIMRDLLDTYKEAPYFLNEKEQHLFNQIRELTQYLHQRINYVRERQGLEPIRKVEGYITHWMDAAAKQVVEKNIPVHSGYLYWLMKSLPKTIKNPTEMKRKVKGIMEKDFSKDLSKLLHIMTAYDLRTIHLTEPYQAAWDELQRLRKERLIPENTFHQVENYLLYDIRKYKTRIDDAFDVTLKKPADLVNKMLAPFNATIRDPSRAIFGTMRRFAHLSGLGFRLKPPIRNLGQRLLLLDLYRTQDYARAQAVAFGLAKMPTVKHPVTGENIGVLDLVREQDWYQASLKKFEDVYSAITGTERAAMFLYGKTHVGSQFLSNVEVSALTGYFDWLNSYQKSKDVNSEHFKNITKQSKRLGVPSWELRTQESDMLWNIRESVRRTQWEYMSISMPTFFRGEFNRAMGIFQSWWMNYFFNHSREAINQIITGRNSLGRLLTPYGRLRALKGVGTIQAIGRTAEQLFGIAMLKYLFIPVPGYLPPIPELIAGILQYFAADNDKERKRAATRIKYGLKFWVPFSAFMRDANRLLSGEYDLGDFLFYRPRE